MKTKIAIFSMLLLLSILSCQKELRNLPIASISDLYASAFNDDTVLLSVINQGNGTLLSLTYDNKKRLARLDDTNSSKLFNYNDDGLVARIILRKKNKDEVDELVYKYNENSNVVDSIIRNRLSFNGAKFLVSTIKIESDILGRKVLETEVFAESDVKLSYKYEYDANGNTIIYHQLENGKEIRTVHSDFDNHQSALSPFSQLGLLPGEFLNQNNMIWSYVENFKDNTSLELKYDIHYNLSGYPVISVCDINGICQNITFGYIAMK